MVSTDRLGERLDVEPVDELAAAADRHVVAVLLEWRGRVGLLKRSSAVRHDCGKWHCITGFLDVGRVPSEQARTEIAEEAGLGPYDLDCVVAGPVIALPDDCDAGTVWTVHTFLARTGRRSLELNWENDAFRWVKPRKVGRFDGQVSWLGDVMDAVSEHLDLGWPRASDPSIPWCRRSHG